MYVKKLHKAYSYINHINYVVPNFSDLLINNIAKAKSHSQILFVSAAYGIHDFGMLLSHLRVRELREQLL